jgi:hypothetical protein
MRRKSLGSEMQANRQLPEGKWVGKIRYPISINSRPLPTFCSSIVARLYSVILRVKVSGIRQEAFELEVPLQVVHTSPEDTSSGPPQYFGAAIRPVEEFPSFLESRRASDISSFSNTSLVSVSFFKADSF